MHFFKHSLFFILLFGVLAAQPMAQNSCNKNANVYIEEDDELDELGTLSEKEVSEREKMFEQKIYELEFEPEPARRNMSILPKYKFADMVNNAAGDEGRLD